MSKGINWLHSVEEGRKEAERAGKPILILFYGVTCGGSAGLFKNTFVKASVRDEVDGNFVPVLLEYPRDGREADAYGVFCTPAFVIVDGSGFEAARWVGYLPEHDFISYLKMALAMAAFRKGDFTQAERALDDVLYNNPISFAAPKAAYFLGLAKFRRTGEALWLMRAYEYLREAFPDSVWTVKASPWSGESIRRIKKAA